MKPTLYILALSVLTVFSCKKEPELRLFELNNVHDIAIISGQKDSLNLEAKKLDGNKIEVSLSVSGLPQGVTASFSTTADTPSFHTTLHLEVYILAPPGDYPITIKAESEAATRTYDLILRISQGNYWKIREDVYRPKGYASYVSGNYYSIVATDSAGHDIVFEFYNGFPATMGSYELINFPVAPNQVAITTVSGGHSYISAGAQNNNATVQVAGTSTTISATDFLATSISSPTDSVRMSCFMKTGGM